MPVREMLRRGGSRLAIAVVLAALPATQASASGQQATVPPGFVGVVVGAPLFPNTNVAIDLDSQLDLMISSGVQSLRVPIDWASCQPYHTWAQVPSAQRSSYTDVGGIPTNFTLLDQIAAEAARRGLTLLPMIIDAPKWDALKSKLGVVALPRSDGPYARFLAALVHRYGPHGTFWQEFSGPEVPIRMWQIWNEPNITAFWPLQPFARRYVALLKAAHDAIKSADPGAKVVLAGLPNYSWRALSQVYAVPGARRLFDVVAVHPYTKTPQGVITILTFVRRVMNAHGDSGKPMIADEVSWPSSLGQTIHDTGYDFATTEAGQAKNLAKLLPLLAQHRRNLRLQGFYYYTWVSVEKPNGLAFDYAGLLKVVDDVLIEKPALAAFARGALALEGCQPVTTVC